MAGDLDSLNVKMVFDTAHTHAGESNPEGSKRRRSGQKEPKAPKTTKRYFRVISKAVERSNQILKERSLALQFKVYLQGEEVFIDLVKLDKAGEPTETVRRNITYDDFNQWIEDVSQMEGVFFDRSA